MQPQVEADLKSKLQGSLLSPAQTEASGSCFASRMAGLRYGSCNTGLEIKGFPHPRYRPQPKDSDLCSQNEVYRHVGKGKDAQPGYNQSHPMQGYSLPRLQALNLCHTRAGFISIRRVVGHRPIMWPAKSRPLCAV